MTDNSPRLTEADVRGLLDAVENNPPRVCVAWCGKAKDECACHKAGAAVDALNAAAPTLARTLLAAWADAEAAVALAYETAAQALDAKAANYEAEANQTFCGPIAVRLRGSAREIRALASASGLAAVQELRAEVDGRNREMLSMELLSLERKCRAEKAESERDTLAAKLAAFEELDETYGDTVVRLTAELAASKVREKGTVRVSIPFGLAKQFQDHVADEMASWPDDTAYQGDLALFAVALSAALAQAPDGEGG